MAFPNIILIVSDQHRWDCAGFAGNTDVRTPNLDALAAHGVWYPNAYTPCPAGAPARTTLLTGLQPWTHGVVDNKARLPESLPLLPRLLRMAGYRTACFGKMHLNPPRPDCGFDAMHLAEPEMPGRAVDDYHAWLRGKRLVDLAGQWSLNPASAPASFEERFQAAVSNLPESAHATTWTGNESVRFIQRAREPFLLWVGFPRPHPPYDPPAPWARMYDPARLRLPDGWQTPDVASVPGRPLTEPAFREVLACYYALLSHMDRQIGRILATLTARGFTNNILVYCSDHGDCMGWHGLLGKPAGLACEAVLRVPLIVAGLAGQRRGRRDESLTTLADAAPTLLEAAGLSGGSFDGRSLVPNLRQGPGLREAICAVTPAGAVIRSDKYKLIEMPGRPRQLYDLEKDPQECENIAGRPAASREESKLSRKLVNTVGAAKRSCTPVV